MRWWLRFLSSVCFVGVGALAAQPDAFQGQGSLRVLVEFRLDTDLCATEPAAVPCQQGIARGREALLQELQGKSYQILRVYATIPFIAVEVSQEALRYLEGSPRVLSITPDTLHAPQSPPQAG